MSRRPIRFTETSTTENDVENRAGAATPTERIATGDLAPRRTPGGRVRGPGRDRIHRTPRRSRSIFLRYSEDEYTDIAAAAGLAGLTTTSYAAESALAAARQIDGPPIAPLRAAMVEVMAARTQVRRFAVNVNQAMAQLHGLGEPPTWLADAVRRTTAAVARLDDTAHQLARATRQRAPRTTDGDER